MNATNATQEKARPWQKRYLDGRRRGLSVSAAAVQAGVHRSTVYRARTGDESFAEAEEDAIAEANGAVENAVWRKAIEGNVTAAIFWLTNREPDEWADRRVKPTVVNVAPDGRTESEVDQRIRELVAKLEARGEAAE